MKSKASILQDNMSIIMLFAIGLSMIAVALNGIFVRCDTSIRCTVKTVGTIVEVGQVSYYDDYGYLSYIYYPTVEYMAGGNSVVSKCAIGTHKESLTEGLHVGIRYNPDVVEEFILEVSSRDRVVYLFVLGMGIAFIVVTGAIVIVLNQKQKAKK